MAEVWWHVLASDFHKVVSKRPCLDSRTAVGVAVLSADHDRSNVPNEPEQSESAFAPVVFSRNSVVQHLGC